MPLTFSEHDLQTVNALQAELTTVLLRAKAQRVEAAIAAFACIRCARILLDQYSPNARDGLLEQVVIPFLRGDSAESNILVHRC